MGGSQKWTLLLYEHHSPQVHPAYTLMAGTQRPKHSNHTEIWNMNEMPLKIFDKNVLQIQSISDTSETHACVRAIMSDSLEHYCSQWSNLLNSINYKTFQMKSLNGLQNESNVCCIPQCVVLLNWPELYFIVLIIYIFPMLGFMIVLMFCQTFPGNMNIFSMV